MAVADAIRKKRRDCLNGRSRFFVPAGFTKGKVMSEVQETSDKEVTPEWMAALTFESLADAVPLDDMPDNDFMAERGIGEGIWMRTCAVKWGLRRRYAWACSNPVILKSTNSDASFRRPSRL